MDPCESNESEDLENLLNKTMQGKWEEVVEIYEKDPSAHKMRITNTGETALHVAVTEEKEEIVAKLVEVISKNDKEALRIQNDSGYTPLHEAASIGSKAMCKYIADAYPSLVGVRTIFTETPLFIAVLHGQKDAFFYLHNTCFPTSESLYSYSTRSRDGKTILHAAIARDYFDLAYQIIYLYPDLVNSVTHDGFTPLHVLATKSSAFKSGSTNLGFWKRLIYECIIVKELKADPSIPQSEDIIVEHLNNSTSRNEQEGSSTTDDVENPVSKDHTGSQSTTPRAERKNSLSPADYGKFLVSLLLTILEMGSKRIEKFVYELKELKKKHYWSFQVMNELFHRSDMIYNKHVLPGATRKQPPLQDRMSVIAKVADVNVDIKTKSIILIAAESGVTEIVERILDVYPVAIQDRNAERKNILILAAEKRQTRVYNLLIKKNMLRESIIRRLDIDENSVLHLAATYAKDKPWPFPGVALQMQWEIKWFQFVKDSMPPGISLRRNSKHETPEEVFSKTHEDLIDDGRKRVIKTTESCSVVAALVAGVCFATCADIPGGTLDDIGKPILQGHIAFQVFSISSLIAICFSVTALVIFLSITTSRIQEKDFETVLPRKLLLGLTLLFVSIGAMLVCFCAGHFLMVQEKFKYAAFPAYAFTCLPLSIFAAVNFPPYFNLVRYTFMNPFARIT